MILYKNKEFISNSDHPNDDWIGNADYILDDEKDAELIYRIIHSYPNFEFIVDDNNKITGIVEIEPKITEEELNKYKNDQILRSKQLLSQWLSLNPYLYTNGKYYSVTEEKQSLLNNNLASYERAATTGVTYSLKWNSTGDECVPWEYTDLLKLSLSIAAYVAPKVSMQQSYEIQIKNCNTIEEIDSIVIDYDKNGDSSETDS